MSVIEFSLKRRVTVCMITLAVVIFGFVGFTRLPINLLPDISYPTLTIETRLQGAAPGEVESLVSRPIEEAVGIVAGARRLTSVSRPGLSQVTLEFGWGQNMDFAALDVRQKLDLLTLPREAARPVLLRFDPANDPVLRLYVTGSDNLYQLRYVADEVLKKDLESTEGVAAIKVNGGYEEEIQVTVDEGKLALLGLTIQDVGARLGRENINQAGGSLYEAEARYLVRSRNEFEDLDDILQTVLTAREGRTVRVADVARVVRSHKQREVITRFGGAEAVELAIYKEGDANTVKVARSMRERLERTGKELPAGMKLVTGADQSRYINDSINDVIGNAWQGGLFAIVVLLLFLKDLRSTTVIGVSIPISIITTFFMMYQTGTTLNIMSLGGLALGVGMLVDNAIVVVEAIYRRGEEGASGLQAVQTGASQVAAAVVASTLTTVAVFVPVVFVEGIAAQLFRDQAITVSFSLLASLVVSLTLIPLMLALSSRATASPEPPAAAPAGRLRRWSRAGLVGFPATLLRWARRGAGVMVHALAWLFRPLARVFDASMDLLVRTYPGILGATLRARGLVLVVALAAFIGSLWLGSRLGVNLIPQLSQGEFSFRVELPEGTPLAITDRYVAQIQKAIESDPRVDAYSSTAGGAGLSLTSTGTEGENIGRIQVRMKPETRRAEEEAVAAILRDRLEASGSARYKFERPALFSFRTPVEVEVYGDSLSELQASAAAVRDRVGAVSGLVDVKSSLEAGSPELQITFNRDRLAALGLELAEVAGTVRSKVQGDVATRFTEKDREIDILVRSLDEQAASAGAVEELIVAQRDGVPIRLKGLADVRLERGPSEIRRIGQKRAAVISANLSGRDMRSVSSDVREEVRLLALPAGVTAGLSGQEEEMQRSFGSLMLAMSLALFLVYLVMACQFESLIHPLVVMFTVPLGAIGVVLALWITGNAIDAVAMIGMVMLAGIVVNNAILLIDTVNQLREGGMPRQEALLQAGLMRMRPILMTTGTTVLGLLPMALGIGQGAELRSPLAITMIGGMTLGTALTLIVIPLVYTLLDRKVYQSADAPGPAAEAGAGEETARSTLPALAEPV